MFEHPPHRSRGSGRRSGCFLLAVVGLATLALAGCDREVQVRGNLPDPETIAEIQPGVDDRDSVVSRIGSPSTVSTFLDRKWYYIGQKTSQFAFLEPDILERSILVVTFSNDGVVDDTKLYTLEDGVVVDPVSRVTPTEGRELTILQQLFGNLGKIPLDTETQ